MTESEIESFCEVIGEGSKNLLFVHGFGLNRKCWYDLIPYLQEDYKLYLVDLIGFGNSKAPRNWQFTPWNQAKALLTFIEKNNLQNITLIGQSYGGGVVLLLQLLLEERQLADRVNRLVVLAPAIYQQRLPIFVSLPGLPVIGYLLLKTAPARLLVKSTLSFTYFDKSLADNARVDRYIDNMQEPSKLAALAKTARHIIPDDIDSIAQRIDSIDKPVLIIYGKNDIVILRQSMERLAESIKGSQFELLENCGHAPQEEKPAEVASLIKAFIGQG